MTMFSWDAPFSITLDYIASLKTLASLWTGWFRIVNSTQQITVKCGAVQVEGTVLCGTVRCGATLLSLYCFGVEAFTHQPSLQVDKVNRRTDAKPGCWTVGTLYGQPESLALQLEVAKIATLKQHRQQQWYMIMINKAWGSWWFAKEARGLDIGHCSWEIDYYKLHFFVILWPGMLLFLHVLTTYH